MIVKIDLTSTNEWIKKLNLMCHAHAIPNSIVWNMMIKPILYENKKKILLCCQRKMEMDHLRNKL